MYVFFRVCKLNASILSHFSDFIKCRLMINFTEKGLYISALEQVIRLMLNNYVLLAFTNKSYVNLHNVGDVYIFTMGTISRQDR